MGGGKGKGKGKGFKGKGFFPNFERQGPVLREPPLYPMDKMRHLPPADYPECREDVDLIADHRRLYAFWKTSPYPVCSTPMGQGPGPQRVRRHGMREVDPERQMYEITHAGGVSPDHFPGELLLRNMLKIRGKPTEKSVLDALKRAEGRESRDKAKERADEEVDGKDAKEGDVEAEDDDDDDELDNDDYVDYGDVEDGMGNDFDEADGDAGDGADF
eukprot:NODE_14645_length_1095_cov_8.837810.p1 GENE.NODE_14645_length_1095_cov_8.837810~~NODE_14645_length_1095_cov_8.837810.p1  ORF type:complete len:216 (-),score=52.02 NODE_14645_length_1095_cov_8.837810:287-934(-)